MVATEDEEAVTRIGKIAFTIRSSDSRTERTSREARAKALTRWLLAQWRLERGEAAK